MVISSPKVRRLPKEVESGNKLIQEALQLGCIKAKIIKTQTIVLGHWLRVQCQYGCSHFGKRLTCPPFTPIVDEVSDLLAEYQSALLIETEKPERIQEIVVTLEENLKQRGNAKAFALCSTHCDLCQICSIETFSQYPANARPSMRAFGIDVSETVLNNGWDISIENDFCQQVPIGLVLID